jgi:hypothetical protein
MRPSAVQLFVAHDGPGRVLRTLGACSAVVVASRSCAASLEFGQLDLLLWCGAVLVLAFLAGWVIAFLASWPIVGPLYYSQGLKNGAPYQNGDSVLILVGAHRHRVVTVYDVWSERDQVRVQLGEREHEDVTDVYSFIEVCRAQDVA